MRGHAVTPTIYFVRAKVMGLIKIGYTVDILDRLKTLQVGSPDKLELIGAIYTADAYRLEPELHDRFAEARSHGEWFHPTAELLAFIATHPPTSYERAVEADILIALGG